MTHKVKKRLKNFSYTISSNLLSFIISTLVVLIVPKLIGMKEFGYWQLYLFYSSFVGFLQFGWTDGLYLRYGGYDYQNLDKSLISSQFRLLLYSQIVITLLLFITIDLLPFSPDKTFVYNMTGVCLIFVGTRALLLFLLQATSRIKDYAQITVIDRIIYLFVILFFLVLKLDNYKLMIFADLIGKFISLLFAIYICKDIVFHKMSSISKSMYEAAKNINSGIKLMLANITSMLIIGVVRFGIEKTWDIEVFAKVSLSLSISNMAMIIINSIGIVMFPMLRKSNQNNLPVLYITLRSLLMHVLLGFLVLYYPMKVIMLNWLPQYADSLKYMALLFPIVLFEGKMALLINTYFKALRLEKLMLKVNIVALIISGIFTVLSTYIFGNLDIAVISIVVVLSIRSIIAELYLSKKLNVFVMKNIIIEVGFTLLFIVTCWYIDTWYTIIIYGACYLLSIFYNRNEIINDVKKLIKE